jgi:hypothetical protein
MCVTKKTKNKKFKKNKIVPYNKPVINTPLCEELLLCNKCNKLFTADKIKIHCSECLKFYHCGVAGRCIGKECTIKTGTNKHSLGYCLTCVDLKLSINCDKTNRCICKTCQNREPFKFSKYSSNP